MSYPPVAYVAAAVGYRVWHIWHDEQEEHFYYPKTPDEFSEWFERNYNGRIDRDEANAAIALLDAVGLIQFDEDEFAGRFLRIDGQEFSARWRELTTLHAESPFAKGSEYGEVWFKSVFNNEEFWTRFRADDHIRAVASLSRGATQARERIIFLAEGSADGKALAEGLQEVSEEIRTSNEIAAELGDDRARILSEVSASRDLVTAGRIRKSVAKELILKVLREIAQKLKDKMIALSAERLIEILLRLLA